MRSHVVGNVVVRALEVLEHRGLVCFAVVKGNVDFKEVNVAGFANVVANAKNQPKRVVVKVGADVGVSALCQRLELVVGASVLKLSGGHVVKALADAAGRQLVRGSQHVLRSVAEAESASDSALKVRGAAGKVVSDDALVLVPNRHAVKLFVAALKSEVAQSFVPEGAQVVKRLLNFFFCVKLFLKLVGLLFVDNSAGCVCAQKAGFERRFLVRLRQEFFVVFVFDVAQDKDESLFFASVQAYVQSVRGDWRPTVGNGVSALSFDHGLGLAKVVVEAQESLAVCVKAVDFLVARIESKVVSALSVFGLVVNRAAFDFDFAS